MPIVISTATPSNLPPDDTVGYIENSLTARIMAMACAAVVLFIVVLVFGLVHIYSRCFFASLRRRQRLLWLVSSSQPMQAAPRDGLHKSLIDQLPTFVYTIHGSCSKEELECAVCLTDFQEEEEGRRLPQCGHSFHTVCIDRWFISNSTCPLCRIEVKVEDKQLLPSANEVGLTSAAEAVAVSIPFDLFALPSQGENGVFDSQQELAARAAAAAAVSIPGPTLSVSSPECITVNHSSERRRESSEEEAAAASCLCNGMMHGSAEKQVKVADPALSQLNQALQPQSFYCAVKSEANTRSKKAPHLVIQVPRPSSSANCMISAACSKTADDSFSPSSTCKSPLCHFTSMRWSLLKDRKLTPPSGSSITHTDKNIIQASCQTPKPASACRNFIKLCRSLPSSPVYSA